MYQDKIHSFIHEPFGLSYLCLPSYLCLQIELGFSATSDRSRTIDQSSDEGTRSQRAIEEQTKGPPGCNRFGHQFVSHVSVQATLLFLVTAKCRGGQRCFIVVVVVFVAEERRSTGYYWCRDESACAANCGQST